MFPCCGSRSARLPAAVGLSYQRLSDKWGGIDVERDACPIVPPTVIRLTGPRAVHGGFDEKA